MRQRWQRASARRVPHARRRWCTRGEWYCWWLGLVARRWLRRLLPRMANAFLRRWSRQCSCRTVSWRSCAKSDLAPPVESSPRESPERPGLASTRPSAPYPAHTFVVASCRRKASNHVASPIGTPTASSTCGRQDLPNADIPVPTSAPLTSPILAPVSIDEGPHPQEWLRSSLDLAFRAHRTAH